MFRLIKFAAYGLMGYALYQMFQGMTAESGRGGRRGGGGSRDLDRALNKGRGRMQTLTGPDGIGQAEQTLDTNGTSVPHRVGRGAAVS